LWLLVVVSDWKKQNSKISHSTRVMADFLKWPYANRGTGHVWTRITFFKECSETNRAYHFVADGWSFPTKCHTRFIRLNYRHSWLPYKLVPDFQKVYFSIKCHIFRKQNRKIRLNTVTRQVVKASSIKLKKIKSACETDMVLFSIWGIT